jgi:ADP-ribosylglycohydrolase
MADHDRIRNAWLGRISGCQLGKPVELLSMQSGTRALTRYLEEAGALPLRDYVPYLEDASGPILKGSCKGHLTRSEPDDDIHYSVLALVMLERHGAELTTADVGRHWMRYLPVGMTFTAERAAYIRLAERAHEMYAWGADPGFDLAECSDNDYNDWIGAQIRADVYGWVCAGRPELAATLARRDAELSHRGDGIYGAVFVAALGAAIPAAESLEDAVDLAASLIPQNSRCAEAIAFARSLIGKADATQQIHERYAGLSPVHTVNNLALVVWGLLNHPDDFSEAIGETVAAGLDTDCNGATVGGLWGLTGRPIPLHWVDPWYPRVGLHIAGHDEVSVDDLAERTVAVSERMAR